MGNLYQLFVYPTGTFFFYPHKPFLAKYFGADYATAYKHFRPGHATDFNLWLHFLCLLGQLAGNFGLLAEFDAWFPGLAAVTVLLWAVTLVVTASPRSARLASLVLLIGAYTTRHVILDHWQQLSLLHGVLDALAVGYISEVYFSRYMSWIETALVGAARTALFVYLAQPPLAGILAEWRLQVNLAFFLFLAIGSQVPLNVSSGTEYLCESSGALLGWIVSALTNDPMMLFLCSSFSFSFLQGVGHVYAKESSTMPGLSKIEDELGHTTYFPTLLMHSLSVNIKAHFLGGHGRSDFGEHAANYRA